MVHLPRKCSSCGNSMYHYGHCGCTGELERHNFERRGRIVELIAALSGYDDPVFPIIKEIGSLTSNRTAQAMLRHLDAKLRSFGSSKQDSGTGAK